MMRVNVSLGNPRSVIKVCQQHSRLPISVMMADKEVGL